MNIKKERNGTAQTVFKGRGSAGRLRKFVETTGAKRVFLVTDSHAFKLSGAEKAISDALSGTKVIKFSGFALNPRLEDILAGVKTFLENPCDLILGVGGGSSLDIAKALSIFIEQETNIPDLVRDSGEMKPRRVPTAMVPTTAGTGSESTHFAVVYIDKMKYSLAHPSIMADAVFLDPALTDTMPPYLTASTGMDAICQAVEAFWSVRSTEDSKEYSHKALDLILPVYTRAVNNPDEEARDGMLYGSHESGKAINIARTTAAHALSYVFTSHFGIPHGHAVALTLPYFFAFNSAVDESNCQDPRGAEFVVKQMKLLFEWLGVENAKRAEILLLDKMEQTGLESSFKKLGIYPTDIALIKKTGFNNQRAANNPRRISEDDFLALMSRFLKDGAT
jgi:alcohol dehydrogenase